jgi:hypothetical protein
MPSARPQSPLLSSAETSETEPISVTGRPRSGASDLPIHPIAPPGSPARVRPVAGRRAHRVVDRPVAARRADPPKGSGGGSSGGGEGDESGSGDDGGGSGGGHGHGKGGDKGGKGKQVITAQRFRSPGSTREES